MSAYGTLTAHVVTREEAAWVMAERVGGRVLDWETGEYA